MTVVVQRVKQASCMADGVAAGQCAKGLLLLCGVLAEDTRADAEVLAKKIAKLRIFTDENDKMNLSVLDTGGSALVISNFTLGADVSHGNRPSFTGAAAPAVAEPLYETFCELLAAEGVPVERGVFGADMQIGLTLDGTITILMDSRILNKHDS